MEAAGSNPVAPTRGSSHARGEKGLAPRLVLTMVFVVQMVRTPDCDSGGREFKSRQTPDKESGSYEERV